MEKALAVDPNHLPAVYLLAKILEQEANIDAAIELLKKQLGMVLNISQVLDLKFERP